MKKDLTNMVSEVAQQHAHLSTLSVDAINKMAPEAEAPELEMTMKQRADAEGARYIVPTQKMPAFGKLPEKQRKDHERDWQYVRGLYENYTVIGESIKFWFSKYPGDPDCLWEIPANVPVYVPRMIAKHLEEAQVYHSFSEFHESSQPVHADAVLQQFRPTRTHYRGKFRPVGAFA